MRLIGFFVRIIILFLVGFSALVLVMVLMGKEPATIISGSMRPKMPIGSICFIDKDHPFEDFKVGDIIVYNSKGKKIVHRIVEIKEDGYKTKGDANSKVDVVTVNKDLYYGKCIFYIPYVGLLVMAFQSTTGKIIFVILLLLLFCSYFMLGDLERKETI